MVKPIRRVVTGHDVSGKAVVVSDGPAENIIITEHRPGGRTNLWRTTSNPANYDGDLDAADARYNTEPVPSGTNFRINEFPPEDPEQIANVDPLKAFAVMGAAHRVVEDARLLAIPANEFLSHLRTDANIAINMLASMSRHMRHLVTQIEQQRAKSVEGDPETVKAKIESLAEQYETDDVIVLTITHDYAERQRSYELLAEVFELKGEGRVESVV